MDYWPSDDDDVAQAHREGVPGARGPGDVWNGHRRHRDPHPNDLSSRDVLGAQSGLDDDPHLYDVSGDWAGAGPGATEASALSLDAVNAAATKVVKYSLRVPGGRDPGLRRSGR